MILIISFIIFIKLFKSLHKNGFRSVFFCKISNFIFQLFYGKVFSVCVLHCVENSVEIFELNERSISVRLEIVRILYCVNFFRAEQASLQLK